MADGWGGAWVLVVDDDDATRELLKIVLDAQGHRCFTAQDAPSARAQLDESQFDLALCDIEMPGESGLDLAHHITTERNGTAVLMVSTHDDPELAGRALEFGAYGYMLKPFRPKELVIAVAAALRRRAEELDGRRDRAALERETAELRRAVERLEQSIKAAHLPTEDTLQRLIRAIGARSHETGGHIERVGRYAARLAERVGLDGDHCHLIRRASSLHDIGKVAVSDQVLLKPAHLSPGERQEMQRHAEIGHYVLSGSDDEVMRLAAEIALSHHERFDGRGYPRRLTGKEIPLEGRIVAIADVFDALTSDRVYREAFAREDAIELMQSERGRQFDPALLDAFLGSLDEVPEIEAAQVSA